MNPTLRSDKLLPPMGMLLLLMSLFAAPSNAQMRISREPEAVVAVFDAMYQYDFPKAEKKLHDLMATPVDPNWVDLAQANLYWWWMVSGDESRDYENLMAVVLNRVIERILVCEETNLTDEQVFTLIHCYAYLTRVDIYREKYFRGIGNLRRTLRYLDIALQNATRYDKFLMISGLYNFFAAATLTEYPIFKPFFALAPRADRQLGMDQLGKCAHSENLLIRNESLYYLMKIDYQLEGQFAEALGVADQLLREYPNNLIYQFHRFMILIEADRREEALSQFSRMILVAASAPGLNPAQRTHLVDIAGKRLRKEKINPAI